MEDTIINTEKVVADESAATDETGSLNYDVEVTLDETEEQDLVSRLLTDNPGKDEEELKDEIEKAKEEVLTSKKEEAINDLKKIDEVKARAGNEDLSDEDAFEIVLKEDFEAENGDPFATKPDKTSFDATDNNVSADEAAKKKLADMEAKVAQAQAVMSEPLVEGYLKFKESGNGDFRAYLKTFEVDKDYDSLPDKMIYEEKLKALGLTAEEIAEEIEEFEELRPAQRKEKVAAYRVQMKAQQEERLKGVIAGNEENARKIAQQQQENHKRFIGLTESLNGKSYHGLNLTADMIIEVQNHVTSGKFGFLNTDGTLNAQKIFELASWDLWKPEILKGKTEQGKIKGRKQEITKRSAPRRTSVKTTATRSKGGFQARSEEEKAAVRKRRGLS